MPEPEGGPLAQSQSNGAVPDAFQRQLSETCVEYFLFFDDDADARKSLVELEALRRAAVGLSQALVGDYIWQRDDFGLELRADKGLRYLYGATDYGDAVEDEWLIVYMLRELTKSHPALWVRLVDSDGEFLLVEAANVLPKWLSPETDQNRVWIHDGKLLIIPPCEDGLPARSCRPISLSKALDFLRSKPDALVHSSSVETEAFYRLKKYPGQVADSAHHSLVTIPRRLAFIVHSLPKSVSPAVEAFYLRDAFALRPIMATSGPLAFPPEDLVTTSVRFTRVLFAQLKSQHFEPPPRWRQVLQASSPSPLPSNQRNVARLEMGMKLTCGFEMLALGADKQKSRVVREVAIMLQDLAEDGDASLPTDREMESWRDGRRDDDDTWMDIDYRDFERELCGRQGPGSDKAHSGFGDAQTQADLRKIVSRFEAFLDDENAGPDGAELGDMDVGSCEDDDAAADEGPEEEAAAEAGGLEDEEVNLDEEVFSRMMREMIGLPAADAKPRANAEGKKLGESGASTLDEEGARIRELSFQLEAELRRHGALKLDSPAGRQPAVNDEGSGADMGRRQASQGLRPGPADEDSDGEVEVDYNLARNLLESFKSQAGMAGPTGNLLGIMGLRLPRDEDDGGDSTQPRAHRSPRQGRRTRKKARNEMWMHATTREPTFDASHPCTLSRTKPAA